MFSRKIQTCISEGQKKGILCIITEVYREYSGDKGKCGPHYYRTSVSAGLHRDHTGAEL